MQQESGVEKSEGENPKTAKWQLQVFNEFLEQHPGIAQDLKKNPNLVNDQHYLSQHSELNGKLLPQFSCDEMPRSLRFLV